MLRTTSTVLVPDCLRTCSSTVGSPLTLAIVCGRAMPSSTRATARTRTGWPAVGRGSRGAADLSQQGVAELVRGRDAAARPHRHGLRSAFDFPARDVRVL